MSNELVTLLKSAPAVLEKMYGDLAQPGCQQVGKAIGTIFGLGNTVLLPIQLLNEKSKIIFERNIESLRENLIDVSPDKIQEVPPEIGVPIIERLTYTQDENISKIFVNLLSNACISDTASNAHPAFIKIIEGLSPDEALLLNTLDFESHRSYPVVQAYLKVKTGLKGERAASGIFTGWERNIKLTFPLNVSPYIDNLCSVGILKLNMTTHLMDKSLYVELENHYSSSFQKRFPDKPDEYERFFKNGIVSITDHGILFLKAAKKPVLKA